MHFIATISQHGISGSARKAMGLVFRKFRFRYDQWPYRHAPHYEIPTSEELAAIERDLSALGIGVEDSAPSPDMFKQFQSEQWFPAHYHGGRASGVWDEKLLEHWIAGELLGLATYSPEDVYIDVAACNSPWAKTFSQLIWHPSARLIAI